MFDKPDDIWLDKNTIKVIDGIAGSAKSTKVDSFFKERKIKYARFVSTNKLKKDAKRRYGGHVETVASGMFETESMNFYQTLKEVACTNVVIDEVLQTDKNVFEWSNAYVGKNNIIMCTDSKQMLAPEQEKEIWEAYEKFCNQENVILIRVDETLRARDIATKNIYNELYASNESVNILQKVLKGEWEYLKRTKIIKYNELKYGRGDVYICHSNKIELSIYDKFNLFCKNDVDLIPKGRIARQDEPDVNKYPILPQAMVKKNNNGYFQNARVGTPTRYQGSEVEPPSKLYYIIDDGAYVSNREFYTVVTRMHSVKSLVIVIMSDDDEPLTSYNGLPVKDVDIYTAKDDDKIDGEVIADYIKNKEDMYIEIPLEDFRLIMAQKRDTETTHFKDNVFGYAGRLFYPRYVDTDEEPPKKNMMYNFFEKEPEFGYRWIEQFYKRLEKVQMGYRSDGKAPIWEPKIPVLFKVEFTGEMVFSEGEKWRNIKEVRQYQYGIDLKSSYPHILAFGELPIGTEFATKKQDGWLDFYLTLSAEFLPEGAIVTEGLKNKLYNRYGGTFLYIGSCPAKFGCIKGREWHDLSHKSIEDKEKLKEIYYGIAMKRYLEPIYSKIDSNVEAFYLEPQQNHVPLMWAVVSAQTEIMLEINDIIYGNMDMGRANADCLYFDYSGNIQELGKKISDKIYPHDFRIFENGEEDKNGKILYQTFPTVKSRKQIRAEKEKRKRMDKKIDKISKMW